jgi:hypothetical protein
MIDGLSAEQLAQQTLCGKWTAEVVLAHVTSFVETGLPRFMGTMVTSGFNFDKASIRMADTQLARPTDRCLTS